MATQQSLSPSNRGKLTEIFDAVLRRMNPPDEEAQRLIGDHWNELALELEGAFTAAVKKALARLRSIVRLTITAIMEYALPAGWGWLEIGFGRRDLLVRARKL